MVLQAAERQVDTATQENLRSMLKVGANRPGLRTYPAPASAGTLCLSSRCRSRSRLEWCSLPWMHDAMLVLDMNKPLVVRCMTHLV